MNQRVVSGLIQVENTMACTTIITRLHSVNIRAIWYCVSPSSCFPRSANPTSNTPTPAETMKARESSLGTSQGPAFEAGWLRFEVTSPRFFPGTVNTVAAATRRARTAVPVSGTANDPAALTIGSMLAAFRAMNTPSVGPSRNPLIPARLTKVRRRARASC